MEAVLAWKVAVIPLWLGLFFGLERLFPASPWRAADPASGFSQTAHLRQNISLWLVNALASPLLVLAITGAAASLAPSWRPAALGGPLGLALDLLVLDLWIYAWHRANHRIPLLWRFHQVHHLDQQLDSTSALRFHVGEVLLSALARAPVILILDIPLASVVVFEVLVTMAAIFHHANVRLPPTLEATLSRVIITPQLHWVHHRARRRDTDSNYGTLLSGWDLLFASRSATRRTPDMVIGVAGQVENRIPRLLLLPFAKTP